MSSNKSFEELKAEIERHRNAVIQDLAAKGKLAEPKPGCTACGGYVQVPALHLSKKYAEEFMDQVYCIYCLSNAMERSVEDLKAEYQRDK